MLIKGRGEDILFLILLLGRLFLMGKVYLYWGKILIQVIVSFGILMQVILISYLVFSMILFAVSLNTLKKAMGKILNRFVIWFNLLVLLVLQMYMLIYKKVLNLIKLILILMIRNCGNLS
jgi:polyhydroxyalkanoate synthesis regulator protein